MKRANTGKLLDIFAKVNKFFLKSNVPLNMSK